MRRLISQIWLGPKPPPAEWMQTWRDLNPEFEYRVWREADIDQLGLSNRRLYDRLVRMGRYDGASDVARAEILLREGGIYVDADSRALRPLQGAAFLEAPFFVVREETRARPYLLNGAFMGADAGHPVLAEYVKALSGVRRLVPTWITTGPVLLTDVIGRVGGAEILEPWVFFVKTLQGEPVTGGDAFGEHYFSSTVGRELSLAGKPYPKTTTSTEGLSVLVAFRDDPPGPRTEVWRIIRQLIERELPEAEIVVGTDDSVPLNKCRALNRAAVKARGSVFLLTDADTWVDAGAVHEARSVIEEHPRRWVKPWNRKCRLDEATTEYVLQLGPSWDGLLPRGARYEEAQQGINAYWASPPLVFSRELFASVGGMDEGFDGGWGSEDAGLAFALKALYGHAQVLRADAIHLYHPRIGKIGKDLWPGQDAQDANQELYVAYRTAARSPAAMRRLLTERREAGVVWPDSSSLVG